MQMAVALMRSVLLTESVEVLPHYHPPGSTQNTESGDSREVMQLSQPQESTWKVQRTRCSPRTSSERWAGITPKWQQAFIAQRWPTVSAFRRRELLGRSGSALTSVHLSGVAVRSSSFCCFLWRKAGSESKGHLLLCCSLQTHQSRAEALLSLPSDGEAFPLQRFFTSGSVQPLPAFVLPAPGQMF